MSVRACVQAYVDADLSHTQFQCDPAGDPSGLHLRICLAKGNVPSLAAFTSCVPGDTRSNGAWQAGDGALTRGFFFF